MATRSTLNQQHQVTTTCVEHSLGSPVPVSAARFSVVPPGAGAGWQRFADGSFTEAEDAMRYATGMAAESGDAELDPLPLMARWTGSDDAALCSHLQRLHDERRGRETTPVPASASRAGLTAPRRILVVDDHHDSAEVLAELLIDSCSDALSVEIGFDGAQAVDLARAHRPAVAVLDIDMPVMDGLEAAMAIRHTMGRSSPVLIAMTGNPGRLEDRDVHHVFDHVLAKPLDVARLAELVCPRHR